MLTAHPTEVQRRSILDSEREIARLLQWRDRVAFTPEDAEAFEGSLYREILGLWQTAMLRLSKLRVSDEIDNGLAYYRYTFLSEVPKLYALLESNVRQRLRETGAPHLPPFFRLGSWIGGDRDGNPNVAAETLHYAIKRASRSHTISRKCTVLAASSRYRRGWSRLPPSCLRLLPRRATRARTARTSHTGRR